ncbi:MAG: YIP1 family protein [Betaproteobacteria bacterium]
MKHLVAILVRPDFAWTAIAHEPMTARQVLGTILPLCLLPALATIVGMSVFNSDWDPLHGYRTAGNRVLLVGLANFVFAAATIVLLALLFHWLAVPDGKRRKPFAAALKLAAFGAVPVLLAGAFLVLPIMIVLTLVAAVHSLYLYYLGMQTVLEVRGEDAVMMLALCVVLLSVASGLLGALASAFGLL